jgi:AraC-like DNA-binding protein
MSEPANAIQRDLDTGLPLLSIFRVYTPRPPLSDFVEMFWFSEGGELPKIKERVLPTGTVEFVIRLTENKLRIYDSDNLDRVENFSGSVICGPQSKFFVIDKGEQDSILGIHFKPGGAFPFFGMPAGEFQNSHVQLETICGSRANELRSRIMEAATIHSKFRIVEDWLLRAASQPLTRHRAVNYCLKRIRADESGASVAEMADNIGLSKRRFIQVFQDQVGLTPKLFHRVHRFQKVLEKLRSDDIVDWAAIASSCGYFDQAHFNHDFREFCGLSPSAYLAQRGEHLNHVPIT